MVALKKNLKLEEATKMALTCEEKRAVTKEIAVRYRKLKRAKRE